LHLAVANGHIGAADLLRRHGGQKDTAWAGDQLKVVPVAAEPHHQLMLENIFTLLKTIVRKSPTLVGMTPIIVRKSPNIVRGSPNIVRKSPIIVRRPPNIVRWSLKSVKIDRCWKP
jgi:hypothetical protein